MSTVHKGLTALACLLTFATDASRAEPGPDGSTLFLLACQACHSFGKESATRIGPRLDGIAGKQAGTATNYPYSDAIKNSGLVWDRATLVAWITGAERIVPGTLMAHHNHLEPREVVLVADHLLDNAIKP